MNKSNSWQKSNGQRVTDLIVLAPQNDPFYSGTPNDWALAEWFASLWRAFGYTNRVHIRRVHYQIISQNPPVSLPNGKPYENTEESWGLHVRYHQRSFSQRRLARSDVPPS